MKSFQNFLDALATKGGTTLLLYATVIALGVITYHLLTADVNDDHVTTVFLSTFNAFSGALLMNLTTAGKANGKPPETLPTPTTTPTGAADVQKS